ncbi:MAG: MBL fold metallo-hydrolase [Candidatus Thermoplasmatota archaeon]|nr:MBL fold metallo-hydrolase [Candidatus Thermoplasmatota archaeon]
MEIHRIVDPSFDVNLYLVLGREEAVLVDAGTGRRSDLVAGEIEAHLAGRPLQQLVLTHRHFDHVGGTNDLVARYAVTPRVSAEDASPIVEGDAGSTGAAFFGGTLEPAVVEVIAEGDRIDVGGGSLEVLSTPGHTVGSICLQGDDGSLFTGDTVFPYGGVGRWDFETGNFDQLLASIKRLNALGVRDLYPGHGVPVQDEASEHLAWALATLEGYGG